MMKAILLASFLQFLQRMVHIGSSYAKDTDDFQGTMYATVLIGWRRHVLNRTSNFCHGDYATIALFVWNSIDIVFSYFLFYGFAGNENISILHHSTGVFPRLKSSFYRAISYSLSDYNVQFKVLLLLITSIYL